MQGCDCRLVPPEKRFQNTPSGPFNPASTPRDRWPAVSGDPDDDRAPGDDGPISDFDYRRDDGLRADEHPSLEDAPLGHVIA